MPVDLGDVTNEEIEILAAELGGFDFSHPERRAFLRRMDGCDVQAAPGAGKTTLLSAKIELIARRWSPGKGAVAVVSHTNVARREIEERLAKRASGAIFLRYPHFVGTLTKFIHEHIALPALRGLGLKVSAVNDEIHTLAATALLRRSQAKPWLAQQSRLPDSSSFPEKLKMGAARIGSQLAFDADRDLTLKNVGGLTDPTTPTFRSLQETKNALTARGIFSYEDLLAVALLTLRGYRIVAQALSSRFHLIILDEAQDTRPLALEILEEIRKAGAVVQRLGDVNQTIFPLDADDRMWAPSGSVLDVAETLRFGPSIAAFASNITPYRAQAITARTGTKDQVMLLIYAAGAETSVIPTFAREVAARLGNTGLDIWAVGHRMNASEDATTPQRVVPTYCPAVRALGKIGSDRPQFLIDTVRSAIVTRSDGRLSPTAVVLLTTGIGRLLEMASLPADGSNKYASVRLLRTLTTDAPSVARAAKRWMSDALVSPPSSATDWATMVDQLLSELSSLGQIDRTQRDISGFLAFDEKLRDIGELPEADRIVVDVDGSPLTVRVGTIASIKGQTHDATLVLDTDFMRMHTVQKAVKHAFAGPAKKGRIGPYEQKVLANMYVAATRPRRLLALACCMNLFGTSERDEAKARGWDVIEVVEPTKPDV